MVGPSHMPPQQPPQPQPKTLATPEEEALKSSTDCVYFLASPLTCKKGAECEYRHSDIARLNPRDCYYWLNGNCLNPKCAFRHPPLEGMLGPQVPAPSRPSLPPSQTAAAPVSSAPHNSGKQAAPCIFFQKGFCLKGDWCPFSHGPVLTNNSKASQGPVAAAGFPEPLTIKKAFVGLQKCSTELKVAGAYIPPKPTEVPLQVKPPSRTAPAKEEFTIERHARHLSGLDDYAPKNRLTTPFANGDFSSRTNHVQQVHTLDDYDTINSKNADEVSREPSPGFDVLVDDELRERDYYLDEDHYDGTRDIDGRRLTPVNDYNIGHSVDYKEYDSMVDADRDTFRDLQRYDSFERMRGQYGRDQRRLSPERISGERRRYPRNDSPDHIDGSDLRYRLSKHRKVNGLISVISHDLDQDDGDRSYRSSFQRDTHRSERIVSDRLRGRIKLPGRSTSPLNERNLLRGRERERGNSWERLSPGRLQGFIHQGGRVQDRIKGRMHEDMDDGGRGFRGPRTREMHGDSVDFAGPKSLSELRARKGNEHNKQPNDNYQQTLPLRKRKYSERAGNDVSFEGPKPLSEILKRKRGGDGNEEDSKGGSRASEELSEDSKATNGQTLERNESGLQMEEGLIVDDDAVEDQEHEEAYAEGEGEYEYEQVEGEYYNKDEAENAKEGEYTEDDDGDDFAEKIGVMFS